MSGGKKVYSASAALFYIFLSIVCVSGSSLLTWLYYQHMEEAQKRDPSNTILALVQTTPEPESLPTVYLAELLGLSVDHPTNLYAFKGKEAEQKLMRSPLIKEAAVRKIRPGTIHVDYRLRTPAAFLADYTNTVIDEKELFFLTSLFFQIKSFLKSIWEASKRQAASCGENKFYGKS